MSSGKLCSAEPQLMANHLHKQPAWQQARTEAFAEGTGLSHMKVFVHWSFKQFPPHGSFLFHVIVQQGTTYRVIFIRKNGIQVTKVRRCYIQTQSQPVQKEM